MSAKVFSEALAIDLMYARHVSRYTILVYVLYPSPVSTFLCSSPTDIEGAPRLLNILKEYRPKQALQRVLVAWWLVSVLRLRERFHRVFMMHD